jgi:hypothetical protein
MWCCCCSWSSSRCSLSGGVTVATALESLILSAGSGLVLGFIVGAIRTALT